MGGPTNIDDDEVQSTRAEAVDEMLAAVRSLCGSKPILCQLQFQTERIISLSCLVVTAPRDVNDIIKASACHVPLHNHNGRLTLSENGYEQNDEGGPSEFSKQTTPHAFFRPRNGSG